MFHFDRIPEPPTKTYCIYDQQTDEYIGDVLAISVEDAEFIAAGTFFDHNSNDMYALSADY